MASQCRRRSCSPDAPCHEEEPRRAALPLLPAPMVGRGGSTRIGRGRGRGRGEREEN